MTIQAKLLGQVRPAVTTAVALWTIAAGQEVWQALLRATNDSGGVVTVTIFYAADGVTFDATTQIIAPFTMADKETFIDRDLISVDDVGGVLAVKASTINAINFSGFGAIRTNP